MERDGGPSAKRRKIDPSTAESVAVVKPKRRSSIGNSMQASRPVLVTPDLLARFPDLEWIVSHVDPTAVIWSSRPDVLPADISGFPGLSSSEQNCANTWFIQDPTPSNQNPVGDTTKSALDAASACIASADALLIVAGMDELFRMSSRMRLILHRRGYWSGFWSA